jgi:hypothetical protein
MTNTPQQPLTLEAWEAEAKRLDAVRSAAKVHSEYMRAFHARTEWNLSHPNRVSAYVEKKSKITSQSMDTSRYESPLDPNEDVDRVALDLDEAAETAFYTEGPDSQHFISARMRLSAHFAKRRLREEMAKLNRW